MSVIQASDSGSAEREKLPVTVLLGPSAERYKGGVSQHTRVLADRLAPYAEVHFYSWSQLYPPLLIAREFRDKVSKVVPGQCEASFMLSYCNPLSWLKFAREIVALNPDKVVFTWVHPVHAPVYWAIVRYLRKRISAEVVMICHNVLPHEKFPACRFLAKHTLQLADRLLVHSSGDERVARSLGLSQPITRGYLPIRDFFVNLGKSESAVAEQQAAHELSYNLLFFGNVRNYKGLDILLEALPLIRERYPRIRLTVAGEIFITGSREGEKAEVEAMYVQLAEKFGVRDIVTFEFRYIPNEEVTDYFHNADVVLFPYRAATQSGPITISYAHGVPVICSAVGGFLDVVEDGVSGYLVQTPDPQGVAAAVCRFYEHPISSESVKEYAKRMSWARYGQLLLNGKAG